MVKALHQMAYTLKSVETSEYLGVETHERGDKPNRNVQGLLILGILRWITNNKLDKCVKVHHPRRSSFLILAETLARFATEIRKVLATGEVRQKMTTPTQAS